MAKIYYMQRKEDGSIIATNNPEFWKELTKTTKQAYVDYKVSNLRERIKPGQKIFTSIKSVSKSGMQRTIAAYLIEDGEIYDISGIVAVAIDHAFDDKLGGVKMKGCGMDMQFHMVYLLGAALWPNGTPEPHGTRNGQPDSDGGYALKHKAL